MKRKAAKVSVRGAGGADGVDETVLHLDHSGLPGGGQLGLLRFLQSEPGREDVVALLDQSVGVFSAVCSQRVITAPVPVTPQRLLALRRWLRAEVKRRAVSVIVANSLRSAGLLALLPKLKGVVYVFYLRVDLGPEKSSLLRRLLVTNIIMPRFDAYLSNSEYTLSTLPLGLAGRPSAVAYPVSGTDRLLDIPPLEPREPLRILSLGRVVAWKGVHILLDAIEMLEVRGLRDRFEVTIAGGSFHEGDDYAREIQARVRETNARISFLGHRTDVEDLIEGADVLVSTSVEPEPFGQVVAQGLSAGRVVIASNAGGPAEMIEDRESGLLFPAGNAEALADVLELLLSDTALVRSIGAAARARARRFSDPVTTEGLRSQISAVARLARQRSRENGADR